MAAESGSGSASSSSGWRGYHDREEATSQEKQRSRRLRALSCHVLHPMIQTATARGAVSKADVVRSRNQVPGRCEYIADPAIQTEPSQPTAQPKPTDSQVRMPSSQPACLFIQHPKPAWEKPLLPVDGRPRENHPVKSCAAHSSTRDIPFNQPLPSPNAHPASRHMLDLERE